MKQLGRWGVLAVAVSLLALSARAQDGPPPGNGFGGGQMVEGTVTGVSAGHLTVKTEQGEIYQVATTDNTRIAKERQPVKLTEIKPGDSVGVMGVLDAPAKTVHAVFVMVVDAERVRKLRAEMGKSFIVGKVTAIDELKLTIQRSDNVSQVIAVDEGTSFRRGGRIPGGMMGGGIGASAGRGTGPRGDSADRADGSALRPAPTFESITLADIKVGDTVGGPGEIKNGTFTPTQLTVADPNARRRQRPEGAQPSGTPQ